MLKITALDKMQAWSRDAKRAGKTVGFVPTMGCLHKGHVELVRHAAAICDQVVVSVFVNPLQFGPQEDFAKYPRDSEGDARKVQEAGADIFFIPDGKDFYPEGFETHVVPGSLAEDLCGKSRPSHFQGVATVVAKLFNIVLPDYAYFGEKDYQQLQVVKRLVKDLNFPVTIVPVPTVRDKDGLALSSRNQYLSAEDKAAALVIPRTLRAAAERVQESRVNSEELCAWVRKEFKREEKIEKIDYVKIVDPEALTPIKETGPGTPGVLAVALWLSGVRLIDNRLLGYKGK